MTSKNPPFMGETMTCIMCGKIQKSYPHVQSNWTALDFDGELFYVCPIHLGNPNWTERQHAFAYESVAAKIIQIIRSREGKKQ